MSSGHHNHHWTNDELAMVLRMRGEGMAWKDIAEQYGSTQQSLLKIVKRRVLPDGSLKPETRKVSPSSDVPKAEYMRRCGMSWEDIAKALGVYVESLQKEYAKRRAKEKRQELDKGQQRSGVLLCGECRRWEYTGRKIWPYGMIGICERDGATCPRSDRCRYGADRREIVHGFYAREDEDQQLQGHQGACD